MTSRGLALVSRYGPPARERVEAYSTAELLQVYDRLCAGQLKPGDYELLQDIVLARPGAEDALRKREAVRTYQALRAEGFTTRLAAERAGQKHGAHAQTIRQRWAPGSTDPIPLLPAHCDSPHARSTNHEE